MLDKGGNTGTYRYLPIHSHTFMNLPLLPRFYRVRHAYVNTTQNVLGLCSLEPIPLLRLRNP